VEDKKIATLLSSSWSKSIAREATECARPLCRKPSHNLTGSGVKFNSLGRQRRRQICSRNQPLARHSEIAKAFMADHASAEAVCAPHHQPGGETPYKRINAAPTLSGATWSPNTNQLRWKQPDTHMSACPWAPVRIPWGEAPQPVSMQAAHSGRRAPTIKESPPIPASASPSIWYTDGTKPSAPRS